MGSIELIEHPLSEEHLAGCVALAESARWNQNAADWRLMLQQGHGWGLSLADGTLVASTLVLLFGSSFAWVSMVLVLPEHRRKGYASRLLRVAIRDLKNRGLTPILDATPAGREVYRQEGFHDTWGFRRFALKTPLREKFVDPSVRALANSDWYSILLMDREAFGANREHLLRTLARRLPRAALVCEIEGRIRGFLLGREGRESMQLGPLVAETAPVANALLQSGLRRIPAPLYVDVVDHATEIRTSLESAGFEFQRPFTRMVYGGGVAPGSEGKVFLVAGPELG